MDRRCFERAPAVVLQLEMQDVARLVIAFENRRVFRRAIAGDGLREEEEDWLHQLVPEAWAELAPRSTDVWVDVLELRVANDYPVKANSMTHGED